MKNKTKPWDSYTYIVLGLLAAIVIFSFPETTSKTAANVLTAENTPLKTVEKPNPFKDIMVEGKSAYVYDYTEGKVLYAKNETALMPLASITKVMTMITAFEMGTPTSTVVITRDALQTEGDTGLLADEQWDLKDLLAFSLVVSSNDGVSAIASSFGFPKSEFINRMNQKARSLGLNSLAFVNESGLDVDTTHAGAYGTVADVSKMMVYAVNHYENTMSNTTKPSIEVRSLDGFIHPAQNTNVLTTKISHLLAGKTGYSLLAGGNLAIVFKTEQQHIVSVVVLGSSYDGRFVDVNTLVQKVITSSL